jgi:hypothetical protein
MDASTTDLNNRVKTGGRFSSAYKEASPGFTEDASVVESLHREYALLFTHLDERDHAIWHKYHLLGVEQGRQGAEDRNIQKLAEVDARHLQEMAIAEMTGFERLISEEETKTRVQCEEVKSDHGRAVNYLEFLKNNQRCVPSLYNDRIAQYYLYVGLILFLTDLFLSWLFVDAIFSLRENSEFYLRLVLTTGLGFLTFYIKVFCDYFLGVGDGMGRFRYKELVRFIGDKNTWRIDLSMFLKGFFSFLVFAAVISIFALLAQTRYDSFIKEHTELSSSVWVKWLFVSISIFLPIVAGIFFSLAQKIANNSSGLDEAIEEEIEIKKKLADYHYQINLCRQYLTVITGYRERWLSHGEFLLQTITWYSHAYEQGYKDGLIHPETSEKYTDPIAAMEVLRNKMMVRKSVSALNQLQ